MLWLGTLDSAEFERVVVSLGGEEKEPNCSSNSRNTQAICYYIFFYCLALQSDDELGVDTLGEQIKYPNREKCT